MKKAYILFLLLLVGPFLFATHNRAGEITYKWLSGFTYEFTITTYTKDTAPADRCELTLNFGDGVSAVFSRTNGASGTCSSPAKMGTILSSVNDVRLNVYKGTHTYQAPGYYTISMQDLNRNGGINNIPNSINIPFYITSTLLIDGSMGANSSPVLTNPPIDKGCTFKKFIHNPSAYDIDGDSLFYTLINCKGLGGIDINSTYDPLYIQDSVYIDSTNGDFIWDVPKNVGQYNFAILIMEYRKANNGLWRLMGTVTRDFQVDIDGCLNQPPVIDPMGPFCVIAGTSLSFLVRAIDPDNDKVILTATGGPFVAKPSAIFQQPTIGTGTVKRTFIWNTTCGLVRKQPYFAQFKATDIPGNPLDPPLSDIETVEITVIAPAPKNPKANANINTIEINWNKEICSKSIGYDIYRKVGAFGYVWDTCETGVPAYTGYVYHASRNAITDTTYIDSLDVKKGVRYCYMVVALFPDGSESIASEEFCAELPKTTPIITHADVLSTDVNTGQIQVRWIPPRTFDSTAFPPPYSYIVERADGIDGKTFAQIGTTASFTDTTFLNTNVNTKKRGYNYRIILVSNGNNVAFSDPASSIFLQSFAIDKMMLLRFSHNTPWVNDTFVVYRENTPGVFDSIGISTQNSYIDTGLVNGQNYCYKALGIGRFTGSGLPEPLLNNSQITCGTPLDTNKPCPPILSYKADCEARELLLTWEDSVALFCIQDIVEYNIYYKEKETDPWPLAPLFTVPVSQKSQLFQGESIVGCYAISAVDDATPANESFLSNIICLEGCPFIELPNVFTPNGSSPNDIFRPVKGADGKLKFRDIAMFRIDIFNRWGDLVYKTDSPEEFVTTGWDGTNQLNGQDCAEGVYYYVVLYSPKSTQQVQEITLNGFIHLFR